jgi:hypothetical protein
VGEDPWIEAKRIEERHRNRGKRLKPLLFLLIGVDGKRKMGGDTTVKQGAERRACREDERPVSQKA